MRRWFDHAGRAGGLFLVVGLAALTLHGFADGVAPAARDGDGALAPSMAADWGECASCHTDQAEALANTQHGKRAFGNLSDAGCQACHGSVERHLDDPTDVASQPRISDLGPRVISDTCQQCHAGGGHMFWKGGRHADAGVTCTDCHSVHNPVSTHRQLKEARQIDVCFSCHKNIRTDSMRASHHPVREGKITCTDCHDPHGTPNDNNIDSASVNEKCYECHAEKRGPFLWEHPPVREDCLNCHTPHGSNHQKLQRTSTPYLCQQCHLNTRHPSSIYDATSLPGPAGAGSSRAFNRACVNCHANIHGSNHPSGPYLGR
ncbi:MAG: DmsE family decaheme c-type cytochrome [Acidobacteriota bacterium]|nr:DmsE family decaheme c-type cytochrome [Acidobacteriota bacterium]